MTLTPLELVYWLLPVALYWPLAAMYVGGAPVRIEGGGGVRQILGVLLAFVLSVYFWRLSRSFLDDVTINFAAILIGTVVTAALIPLFCKLSLRLFGIRLVPADGTHGHAPGPGAHEHA